MAERFLITEAVPQDMDNIRELAVAASVHTFSGLRSTPGERARYVAQEFLELKSYHDRGLYRFLVAKDTERENAFAGYLLLNLYDQDDLGRRQTFVEDIASPPEYWGLGVGHLLFDAATEVTASLGLDFMGGEVSANNSRIEAALRNNFFLESYRVVRPCTPAGVQRMEEVKQSLERQNEITQRLGQLKKRRKRLEATRARRQAEDSDESKKAE